MKFLTDLLVRPFRRHLSLFILLFALTTVLDVYQYALQSTVKFTLLVVAHNFTNCYILTLLYALFPKGAKKVYAWLLGLVVGVFTMMDIFSVVKFHHPFDKDVAAVVRGTNLNEAVEFLQSYVSWSLVVVTLCFIAFCLLLWRVSKLPSFVGKKMTAAAMGLLALCLALSAYAPHIWTYGFFGKLHEMAKVEKTPDLKAYATHPQLEIVAPQPQNVVMIIGESFAKGHSSLYGYAKPTNPRLEKMVADSSLLVFQHINSTATHTVPAFKSFMSTYRSEYGESRNWYEFTTLPEIIHAAAYSSSWISNQSPTGFYDNVVAAYARLCDSVNFIGDQYAGLAKTNLDGELLEPIRHHEKGGHRFFFVHLMGSHPNFEARYPEGYGAFRPADYMDFPEHQRENRAAYDNTILYNDSVVCAIMQEFKEEEAIVIYFSDHGLDVYESDDNYCSHANRSDARSKALCKLIPFVVYTSPAYQQAFPEITRQLRQRLDTPYVTEDILYTLMDVMGVRFKDNQDVERYSLLRK